MTRKELQDCTRKELAGMARDQGIAGWHGMRKDELVDALAAQSRKRNRSKPKPGSQNSSTATKSKSATEKSSQARKMSHPRLQTAARDTTNNTGASAEETIESSKFELGIPTKDLSASVPKDLPTGYGKDRVVLMVRDPYWLHAYWELTRQTIDRAEAALGQDWHAAKPILRLLDVSTRDTTATTESIIKDIEIHGGCNNWYVEVHNPPCSYRVDIGYLSPNGQFYVLARSNTVQTPRAGMSDLIDENWADIDAKMAERIYAMSTGFDPTASSLEIKELFEERLRRPMGSPSVTSFGSGAMMPHKQRSFWFQLDAELIVYGPTEPDEPETLQREPVKLR
ncbi:MAG: DUF4912 domain-containing protein, partial [Gemmataceae bacterium]